MSAFTFFGVSVDPDELRDIASRPDSPDFADRVAGLHRAVLTRETLAGPPEQIADRLRAVAGFLERRQRGEPWGGHEFARKHAETMEKLRAMNQRIAAARLSAG